MVEAEIGETLPSAETGRQIARLARRQRRRRVSTAYAFLAPNLVLFLAFMIYPVARLVEETFETGGVLGPASWVGLKNWSALAKDPAVSSTVAITGRFALMYVPAVMLGAFGLALLLREVRWAGGIVRALVYLPSIAPLVLVGVVWVFMLHPDFGLVNYATRHVGLGTPDWLGSSSLALPTVAAVEVWRVVGFWAILLLAALLAVPAELYEAAKIDGASAWRRLVHVTLPAVTPALVTVLGLTVIAALQVFDSAYVLTGGGPAGATQTISYYVYDSIFESGNTGFGAALSLLMVVIVSAGTGLAYLLSRSRRAVAGRNGGST